MHQYGVREVEKLLRLPRSTIRALIEAGFVCPARGPRRSWLFSFQDLIVLRTAQALAAANVPQRRITRSMKELRRHLPDAMPLSGLSICAVADRVVVREGASRWQAESGQYLLAFEGDPDAGSLSVVDRTTGTESAGRPHAPQVEGSRTPRSPGGTPRSLGGTGGAGGPHAPQVEGARTPRSLAAEEWLERGVALEDHDVAGALQAYERAVAAEPGLVQAHVNMGLLLHESGRLIEAERAYRAAIKAGGGSDPVLLYNFGVLLEDMGRKNEALEVYQAALRGKPDLADCHYNLALLCEQMKKPKDAIRHMAQYRRLMAGKPK